MKPSEKRTGCWLPGLIVLAIAVFAVPVFPVLAGKSFQTSATPTEDMLYEMYATPPVLEPTSLLEYPPITEERPPCYAPPLQLRPEDHYWLSRPVPSTAVNWVDPDYRYGSDYFDLFKPHNGVDFPTGANVPVLAVADGVVNWTGIGLFGHFPNINDPYGNAVSIRHDFGYLGQPVFTAYAHLSRIDVVEGQRVKTGDQLGLVGSTGKATGPHLHFEVRVGEDSFYNSRNPELWMVPPVGYGVLAGRIESSDSWPLVEYPFHLWQFHPWHQWNGLTYVGNVTHPDEIYQENFVIGDLPEGEYYFDTWLWWRHYYFPFTIVAGQTTFIVIHSGLDPLINPPMVIP